MECRRVVDQRHQGHRPLCQGGLARTLRRAGGQLRWQAVRHAPQELEGDGQRGSVCVRRRRDGGRRCGTNRRFFRPRSRWRGAGRGQYVLRSRRNNGRLPRMYRCRRLRLYQVGRCGRAAAVSAVDAQVPAEHARVSHWHSPGRPRPDEHHLARRCLELAGASRGGERDSSRSGRCCVCRRHKFATRHLRPVMAWRCAARAERCPARHDLPSVRCGSRRHGNGRRLGSVCTGKPQPCRAEGCQVARPGGCGRQPQSGNDQKVRPARRSHRQGGSLRHSHRRTSRRRISRTSTPTA